MTATYSTRTARVATAAAMALTGVALAAPAVAAPGSGATPYRFSDCYEWPDWYSGDQYKVCFVGRGVYNSTATPSGNYNAVGNDKWSYTFSVNGQQISNGESKSHYKVLLRDDQYHVLSSKYSGKWEEWGQTCTYSYKFHAANGKVQIDDYDFSCGPS